MTDPQSGRDGAVRPGRSDGAAGAVQGAIDEGERTPSQTDPQAGTGGVEEDTHPGVDTDAEKDPADWTTGDEPMTGAQESYLHTLAQEAGEPAPTALSKADASREIDRLQSVTGRGSG